MNKFIVIGLAVIVVPAVGFLVLMFAGDRAGGRKPSRSPVVGQGEVTGTASDQNSQTSRGGAVDSTSTGTEKFVLGGFVRDSSGAPIGGAQVDCYDEATGRPASRAVSDASGKFVTESLKRSAYRLVGVAPGFLPQEIRSVGVPSPYDVTITLERFVGICYYVVDEDGATVADALVEFHRKNPSEVRSVYQKIGEGRTDGAGILKWGATLEDGAYYISISKDGFATRKETVNVLAGVCRQPMPRRVILKHARDGG
jgi:hypothetical protein